MSDRVNHCPFLNRADARCSNHFSLDRLDDAFEHCFGSYLQCGTYQELLAERAVRQAEERTGAMHGLGSRFSVVRLPVVGQTGEFAHAQR